MRAVEGESADPRGSVHFHSSSPSLSPTSPHFSALYRQGLRPLVASAVMTVPVNDMLTYEDASWQDVYASYGCSLDFDVSDDGG